KLRLAALRQRPPIQSPMTTATRGDTMALQKITVIGLGIMGLPMARNLVRAAFTVTVHNRSRGKTDALVADGGHGSDTVAEAVADADAVVTMLVVSPDVGAVLLGVEGVFAHAAPGTLVCDVSTIRPDGARTLAQQGRESDLRVLDAPVSGGE